MNVLMLLRSELRRSAAVLAGIAAVLALSLSISIATGMTDRMLRHASAQAADRFDLLIGAKASPSSLLLGAVFLRDDPLPLVPLSVMKDLDERHGVKWAAPVAFGDRAGDSPIVGTTTSLVTFGGTVRPAEGRLFKAPFEAVVGASAPYRIGDEIVPMHGRTPGAGHAHDHGRLKVVGRMPESGTPWDRAVMIPIEAVWATHSMTVHDELDGRRCGDRGRPRPRLHRRGGGRASACRRNGRCHVARHGLARTSRRRGHAPCGFVLRPHSRMARGEAPHPLSASLRALSERPSPSKRRALVASGVRRQSVIENSRKRLQDVNARSRRRHAALKESVLQAQGNPGKAQTRSPEVPDRDRR